MSDGSYRPGALATAVSGFIATYDAENDIVIEVSRLPDPAELQKPPLSPTHYGHTHWTEIFDEGIELEIESKINKADYGLSVTVYRSDNEDRAIYMLMENQRYNSHESQLLLIVSQIPESVANGMIGKKLGQIAEFPGFLANIAKMEITEASSSFRGTVFSATETGT